jgi:hypothetical protein
MTIIGNKQGQIMSIKIVEETFYCYKLFNISNLLIGIKLARYLLYNRRKKNISTGG